MDIRESVKRLCKERGVTQKDIADRLEITAIGLNQILRKGNPNLQTLERIAAALGVQVVDLFEKEGDFVAFVRRNGETHTFESERGLKEFVDTFEVHVELEEKQKK